MFAIALYFMHYNFVRPHKTLANPYPRTPAMAAGVSDHVWTIEEIVRLADQGYNHKWGGSSIGRVFDCQSMGCEFEPRPLHL